MYRKARLLVLALLLALICTKCGLLYRSSAKAPEHIVLFSWDGVDRSVIKELLEQGKTPHLAALIKEGSFQPIQVVGHPTQTAASHAEMLTGLAAEVTGVYSNSKYGPIPEGYTVFERLENHFGPANIATIMVTGKGNYMGGSGPSEAASGAGAIKEGAPYFLTKKHLDEFDAEYRNGSEVVKLGLRYLERHKNERSFAFIHFSDPDSAGHKYGSGSAEYRQAIVDCDAFLGQIVNWLKSERLYGSTLVYITTDHGFDRDATSHSNAPDCWLATNDRLVVRGGILADIPATILVRFGVDLKLLHPPLLGKSLLGPSRAFSRPSPARTPEKSSAELYAPARL
jgi:hypothetical protein